MTTYKWKHAKEPSDEAQLVGETLEQLREDSGTLDAPGVVQAARPEESPLHKFFEWDDSEAAEKFRQSQARRLIGSVSVIVQRPNLEPQIVRAFVTAAENGLGPYYSTVEVMQDAELRRYVLERALIELKGFQRRYAEYKELASVFSAIESLETQAA